MCLIVVGAYAHRRNGFATGIWTALRIVAARVTHQGTKFSSRSVLQGTRGSRLATGWHVCGAGRTNTFRCTEVARHSCDLDGLFVFPATVWFGVFVMAAVGEQSSSFDHFGVKRHLHRSDLCNCCCNHRTEEEMEVQHCCRCLSCDPGVDGGILAKVLRQES
jgi:hypothetical protein